MWSRKHACCVKCGTTTRKHVAGGKCSRCYMAAYRKTEDGKERLQSSARAWVRRNGKCVRDNLHFGGNREQAIATAGEACELCGDKRLLVVHQKDGNGRGARAPNNDLSNLQVLCRACHARVHNTLARWSRKYDHCICCLRNDIPHRSRGLCTPCYSKMRYHGKTPEDMVRTHGRP